MGWFRFGLPLKEKMSMGDEYDSMNGLKWSLTTCWRFFFTSAATKSNVSDIACTNRLPFNSHVFLISRIENKSENVQRRNPPGEHRTIYNSCSCRTSNQSSSRGHDTAQPGTHIRVSKMLIDFCERTRGGGTYCEAFPDCETCS
jgi:hypothetical protein